MTTTLIIISIILLLLLLLIITIYNQLTKRRNIARDQFSQINIQLKRRFDLIPNLIEVVKSYTNYESTTLLKIVEERNNAKGINQIINSASELNNFLSEIMILKESYPDLKANLSFLELQKELSDTEDKIAIERQFYNDTVLSYNNIIDTFPSSLVAIMFKFERFNFFEIELKESSNINIKL